MAPLPRTTMTVDEYLAFERTSDQRHEFDGVEIYAMAGGTEQHNMISGNVYASLHLVFRRRTCRVYNSDMRVHMPLTGLYTYPDVSALCGEPIFRDTVRDTLLNPGVIVEVLSPSTETYDRSKKFRNYRTLPSLQEYLLIEQDAVDIEHYVRQPNGSWSVEYLSDLEGSLYLASIDCTLEIADIYDKVVLNEA